MNHACGEWAQPRPALPGFPSHGGRLGRTLRGGTCACQMLFSLSFPNLPISFCSRRTKKKARQSQKTTKRAAFLPPCVRVLSTLHFMCQRQTKEFACSCLNSPSLSSEPPPPPLAFPCVLPCFQSDSVVLQHVHVVWMISSVVGGDFLFVF